MSKTEKSISLITALLNGHELEKDHSKYDDEKLIEGLRCYRSDLDTVHFETWGWGSALGRTESRVMELLTNPDKWQVAEDQSEHAQITYQNTTT